MLNGEFLLIILSVSSLTYANYASPPEFDLVRPSDGYHGLISEDRTIVEVQPAIKAGPDVCSFRIASKHRDDLPFTIHLKNDETGEAELLAKWNLDCEKRKNYKFDIEALSCSGVHSNNVTVRVKVNDVNEFAPSFPDESVSVVVEEGRVYDQVLVLRAEDRDCSPKYGDICRYELLTKDQPFVVDGEGIVRNTEPLDFAKSREHVLSLVAYDCGMKRSLRPVLVTVTVKKACHFGWKGIPHLVEYIPGSGRQEILPFASLEICDVPCEVERLQASVSLVTSHVGRGCDRDTYSVASQRKICEASESSIDLLPSPTSTGSWSAALQYEEGADGDVIYNFDGELSGVRVPEGIVPRNLTKKFSISSWMKHKPHLSDKHSKEHLVCSADGRRMNRHHLALFVRNCRLILLLRREFTDADLNTFQPAEWRWKLPQVCDDEWHHYSVQADLPDVKLMVDGHLFHPEGGDASEVIDDWPLHPTRGIKTVLSVGGCWQGSDGVMKHGFKGHLAGLSLLVGSHESPSVLSCLTRCQEALDSPAMELLQPSMELLTNNEMTQITVEGNNVTNVEALIKRIAYINTRTYPTPGRRPISISTNILCSTGKALKVDTTETSVVVLEPHRVNTRIDGTTSISEGYKAFREGLRIFSNVSISASPATSDDPPLPPPSGQLDECSVGVYPPLNPDHEFFVLPDNLIAELGLAATVTRQGATVSGLQTIGHYQQILRNIRYTNKKPAYYLNRAFKLSCSELAGRFSSNEYTQTVTVVHPQIKIEETNGETKIESFVLKDQPSHLRMSSQHVLQESPRVVDHSIPYGLQGALVGSASHAITVTMIVCGGFVLFIVALVVVRIRGTRARAASREEAAEAEMAWDDSALNITVNPLQLESGEKGMVVNDMPSSDDSSDGEDDRSQFNDEIDSSDDEGIVASRVTGPPRKELEWDDSTLKI